MPDLIEKIGADKELPEDIITIVHHGGDSVDILITQLFEGTVTGFSVHYHDSTSSTECDAQTDVPVDDTLEFTAQCFEGYTDVSIFVYFGDADEYSVGIWLRTILNYLAPIVVDLSRLARARV
jgi:hypothetical protein